MVAVLVVKAMIRREDVEKAILAGLDKFEASNPGALAPDARATALATLRIVSPVKAAKPAAE